MTWTVVVNPAAGSRSISIDHLVGRLSDLHVDHDIIIGASAGEVMDRVAEAAGRGGRKFAAVGGDGTAHIVVNALMRREWKQPPQLAVIPTGSATDLIRTFALPRTMDTAIPLLVSGERYRMDLGRIDTAGGRRWFLNVADFGVAAAAARAAQRIPRTVGAIRYPLAFWMSLPGFAAAPVRVESERRTLEADALNVVVANGQFFGGGMNIAPQAAISDGLLDVEVFLGPRRHAFEVMPRVRRGMHLRHRAVKTMRSERFAITVPDHWPIEADGEAVGSGPASVHVESGAIDITI